MKHLLRLTDLTPDDIFDIFALADRLAEGEHRDRLKGRTAVMFFPASSIRTRVSFEKGIYLLGGQSVLFAPETLDKKEDLRDVCGYLDNWADVLIVRHSDLSLLERMAEYSSVPVINAMTSANHPCEILTDLYALSKRRENFLHDTFLFCGHNGNIGRGWKEAADVLGFRLEQCCPEGWEIEGVRVHRSIEEAAAGKDIICTDSLPAAVAAGFDGCRVTRAILDKANPGALLNPCPPFCRGEEVSADAIESDHFVGYDFKKHLLEVQQAVILILLFNRNI